MIRPRSSSDPGSALGRAFFLLVKFFGLFCSSTYATCYFPNGEIRIDETYQPCNPNQEYSMCCRTDYNECRSDGLCLDLTSSRIWRESCTDPTWNSSSCVKLCHSGLGILRSNTGENEIMLMYDKCLALKGRRATEPVLTM